MTTQEIRLEGVYNDQSFQIASDNQIKNLTLDFRPRSFNFLPVAHCKELLEKWGNQFDNFRILFAEDSDLVITEIYKMVTELVGDRCHLELEYFREDLDYRKIDIPFYVQVEEIEELEKTILQPQLKGIILNNHFLLDLAEEGVYKDYLTFIHRLILSNQRNDLEVSLRVDWEGVVPHNLKKWFQINQYILSVSKEVEERYRTIDETSFMDKFQKVQSIITDVEKRI